MKRDPLGLQVDAAVPHHAGTRELTENAPREAGRRVGLRPLSRDRVETRLASRADHTCCTTYARECERQGRIWGRTSHSGTSRAPRAHLTSPPQSVTQTSETDRAAVAVRFPGMIEDSASGRHRPFRKPSFSTRWHFAPWIVLAAAVAVLGLAGCSGSEGATEAESERPPDQSERKAALDHASTICAEYQSAHPELGIDGSGVSSATTVGQIQAVLKSLGQAPITEWASRSDDDFIASCWYPLPTDYESAPTTMCADGSSVNLAVPNQLKILVDEDGKSVPDATQGDPAPRPDPCS